MERHVQFTGTVVTGKQLGRTIGFPTANIAPDAPLPAKLENGVYFAVIRPEGMNALPCMLNQGVHPTVPGAPTIEAHILDFNGTLYGRRVAVEYLEFHRPEQKFDSVDALRRQLLHDEQAARDYFRAHPPHSDNYTI